MEAAWMSISRWMDREAVVHITVEHYSAKKGWNIAISSNMAGPRDDHTKWGKSRRGRRVLCDITYMWNLKRRYKWAYLVIQNTDSDSQMQETTCDS